ncbi:MAG: CoA-acylating methylmalonate-semialdehyde dehydrogenase [Gemmatimonadetes bacterium]|jgi:malonate-semialdehyde dehydrogenase (acetylating) / methylmalonate-semialdehyde dehydrogenase|nr:CoA-acylating methylmalonate-semialdehyde dehydrogenase [Gemmatimonadota bacterium]
MSERLIGNFIDGAWRPSRADELLDVMNPATGTAIARVPMSPAAEVDEAVAIAAAAFGEWRRTPPNDRVQYFYKMKGLLEEHVEELGCIITEECGKTFEESVGEVRRAIENVEVACGIPMLLQGYNNEDIASGIDEHMLRQPLGVVATIAPFNFPAMVPFWFMPYAVACGNCFILKPSEKTPMASEKVFELWQQTGIPAGVVQLVNGGKEAVDRLLEHEEVGAISFVGSSEVARYVYGQATAHGKRAQCQGGAKNPVIVMPDADMEMTAKIVADSSFGCAGQRCLASSLVISVGEAGESFPEAIKAAAASRKVGYGMDKGVEMGPVITAESKSRIEGLIGQWEKEGAQVIVDGRGCTVSGYERGNFVFPTVLENVDPMGEVAGIEIFGPVLGLIQVADLDEAIGLINGARYGNMACLFTDSGAAARKFRYEATVGNVGINIGVAAPMAFFPFSGWKNSFFGDLHGQGRHAVEFFTQTKIVVERWPREWSRKF